MQRQLAGLPDSEVSQETSGLGNEGTDRMRDQFYALQVREKEAQAKYTDEHPKLRQIRNQLAAARKLLEEEEKTRRQVTTEPEQAAPAGRVRPAGRGAVAGVAAARNAGN